MKNIIFPFHIAAIIQPWSWVVNADIAAIYFSIGDLDNCFYHLNQCVEKRMGPVNYFLEYPAYKGIKDDPRYYELLEKMKAPAVAVWVLDPVF